VAEDVAEDVVVLVLVAGVPGIALDQSPCFDEGFESEGMEEMMDGWMDG